MIEFDNDFIELDNSLAIGDKYHYTVGYWGSQELYVEGKVVFNDGVTAVIKVTDSYDECWVQLLYYFEVQQYIPSFYDAEAEKLTEYLCLDVETEYNLFFRDPETDAIMLQHYDEEGNFSLIPADVSEFHKERIKKELIYKLTLMEAQEKAETEKSKKRHGGLIIIDLQGLAIDKMYAEYDKQKGNPSSDEMLNYSLTRSLHWLNNRNCAILTAWRGNYSKAENSNRNQELQNSLRSLGYGVIRVKGCYAEVGKPIGKENSFLVFDLEDTPDFKEKIYEQSERYEQDCFLYKSLDEEVAYLIGTNDHFGKGKIITAGTLRINSNNSENFSEVASGRVSFEKVTHTENEKQLDTDWQNEQE